MGSKREEKLNQNPGPGQYDNDASKLKPNASGSVRIGSAKRQELWSESKGADMPGPGLYVSDTNTFGKAAKGSANMGSKYKPEVNYNPGPGQYAVNDSPTKNQGNNQRISRAERKDIWEEQTKNQAPGPGNYSENTSSFSNIKGGVKGLGSKHK